MGQLNRETAKRILLEIDDLMDIPYFLICGTALGAFRDDDFIEFQFDIDLGVLAEEFLPSATRLSRKFKNAGFQVTHVSEPFLDVRAIKLDKDSIHVDLVSYFKHHGKRFCSSTRQPYSIVQDASLMEMAQPIRFMGREFRIPYPTPTYLAAEYGADWQTPKNDGVSRSRVYNYRTTHDLI